MKDGKAEVLSVKLKRDGMHFKFPGSKDRDLFIEVMCKLLPIGIDAFEIVSDTEIVGKMGR